MSLKREEVYQISKEFSDSCLHELSILKLSGYEWEEIKKILNKKFELDKSSNAYRHAYRKYGNLFESNDKDVIVKKLKEVVRTKQSNSINSKENKLILTHLNEQDDFIDRLKETLKENPITLHKSIKLKKKDKFKRTLVGHLSDTHYGANIEKNEMNGVNVYNWEIASRRTAMFFEQLANYKLEHRKDTDLVLFINGDMTAGVIHNQEHFVDLMTTQFSGSLNILTQGISFIAQHFSKIKIVATVGNHGRLMHKSDKGRSTTHKWDSFETMLYVALKQSLLKYPNIEIIIKEAPYAIIDIQGYKACITHGDTIFNPGQPGKSIDMKSLKNQVNNLNSSLSGSEKIDMVFLGHVHTPTVQKLDNGAYIIINGCLSGLDPYANSIGIFKSHATQQIIEITPEYSIGDMRFVSVDGADNRKELDSIIKPFKDKF